MFLSIDHEMTGSFGYPFNFREVLIINNDHFYEPGIS